MRSLFHATLALIMLGLTVTNASMAAAPSKQSVIDNYADIALAIFSDSLVRAKDLQKQVNSLVASPSLKALEATRASWIAARKPYQQSEAYRFGNAIVDDWEGKVNAWPLDEGLIDYVSVADYGDTSDENALYTANIIANKSLKFGGQTLNVANITPDLLENSLHEIDGVEANVATGYHAIEFLLWGQDLNGTGPGAGNRPASDFDTKNCTNGNCDRRVDYLVAATDLLVTDLAWMADQWRVDGAARKALQEKGENGALATILTGMGSLSYGELAGERMKLGLMLHDPEEEHDCFSDMTHLSHYFDQQGIVNVYTGQYTRIDGSQVSGPALHDLVVHADSGLAQEMKAKLDAAMAAMTVMYKRAETTESYDQMIGAGNIEGNEVVQAVVDALVDQTRVITRIVERLNLDNLEFEGSDSLDNPAAVGA